MATEKSRAASKAREQRTAKLRGMGDPYNMSFKLYDKRTRAEWKLLLALSRLLDKKKQRRKRSTESILRDIFFQRRRVVCRTLTKMGVDYHAELKLPKFEKGGRGHTLATFYDDPTQFQGVPHATRRKGPSMVTRYHAGQ